MFESSDNRETTRVDGQPRLFSVAYVSDELRSIHDLAKLLAWRPEEREDND
jgi:hypothetical protein